MLRMACKWTLFNEQKGLNSSTNQHKCWCNAIYRLIVICNRIWGASWKSGWMKERLWTHGASEREKLYLLPKTACSLYELSRDDDELYITDIHFVLCNLVVVLYCWGKEKVWLGGEAKLYCNEILEMLLTVDPGEAFNKIIPPHDLFSFSSQSAFSSGL